MDNKGEDEGEVLTITEDELQRILDRADAGDVPTLVTALRHTYKVLATQDEAIQLYGSMIVKIHDVRDTGEEIIKTLNDRDYAVSEAVHFLREFRKREQNRQDASLKNNR